MYRLQQKYVTCCKSSVKVQLKLARTDGSTEVRIPQNSYTCALKDLPTRLTTERNADDEEIYIVINGFDYNGKEGVVTLSHNINIHFMDEVGHVHG